MDSVVVFFGDKLEPIKVPAEPIVITSKMKIPYLIDSYDICGKMYVNNPKFIDQLR
jgi:hypothetical protein